MASAIFNLLFFDKYGLDVLAFSYVGLLFFWNKEIKCIFSEPQFNPKIIETIAKDTGIQTGVFDPLGANIKTGKSLYFKLINNLGEQLKGC